MPEKTKIENTASLVLLGNLFNTYTNKNAFTADAASTKLRAFVNSKLEHSKILPDYGGDESVMWKKTHTLIEVFSPEFGSFLLNYA